MKTNEDMKILVLSPILCKRGDDGDVFVEQYAALCDACRELCRQGHDVTLAVVADRQLPKEELPFEVKWLKAERRLFCQPSVMPYAGGMRAFLKESAKDYDRVMPYGVFSWWSLAAARVCPEKTVIWQEGASHGSWLHGIPSKIWFNIVARYLMRNVLVAPRTGDAMRFVSRYMWCVAHNLSNPTNFDKNHKNPR